MPVNHVDALFSAAVDDQLSREQAERFDAHLASCDPCAAAYTSFRQTVESVRALPTAAMPLPVHLPSGAPAAERSTASAWLARLRPRGVPFGAATGVAALAAVAIVVIGLTRGNAPATNGAAVPGRATQAAGAATSPATCPSAAQTTGPTFAYRVSASDPSRPGQELVLSASQQSVAAGTQIHLFAVLTVPSEALGVPGAAAAATAAPISVAPCLSVTGLSAAAIAAPGALVAPALPQPKGASQDQNGLPSGGDTLTIPAGTPPGTVFHVLATVPAGYPGTAQSSLTVSLAITVR